MVNSHLTFKFLGVIFMKQFAQRKIQGDKWTHTYMWKLWMISSLFKKHTLM